MTMPAITASALDRSQGICYIADTSDHQIRVVNTQPLPITIAGVQVQPGNIATIVGATASCGYSSDNAAAASAAFATDSTRRSRSSENVYIADTSNARIRVVNTQSSAITVAGVQIQPGNIATVAGNGTQGYGGDDGPATSAQISNPDGVATDSAGDIYIADTGNHRIRAVNTQSTAITIAGVLIQPGNVATVAGNGTAGYRSGR